MDRTDRIGKRARVAGWLRRAQRRDPEAGRDWKLLPEDVAEVVVGLLRFDPRALPSRVELRPSRPKKG